MEKLFLAIRSNREHNFIIDIQHQIFFPHSRLTHKRLLLLQHHSSPSCHTTNNIKPSHFFFQKN